ncbi:MAG: hypothetical protein OEM50_08630 [Gammaproteobacteria bacterium]|nr:hypothetical protein [Gammaproteobacteria bacterium]MDH3362109.1 hypothetical protein [Gammaproteobacteria bacterium]MDH3481767.1 hypothetical protein [Gammaproteobacteria bacterium]
MNKSISVFRKIMPVLLGMLLASVSAHTAIADHKPNHVTNPNSLAMTIDATFNAECTSVTASSDKDISNVVLLFTDGTWEKFDDLDVPEGDFAGTADNSGKTIESAYIKSGSFRQPVDFIDPDSGKVKMINVGETFSCTAGPALS